MHRYYCKHGDVVSPYNSCIFWSHHLRWSNQEVDKKCKGYYWNNMLWRKVTEEKFPRINCKLSGELWSVSIPTIGQRLSVVMLLAKFAYTVYTYVLLRYEVWVWKASGKNASHDPRCSTRKEVIDEVASKVTTKQNVSHNPASSARLKSEKSIKGREEGPKKGPKDP